MRCRQCYDLQKPLAKWAKIWEDNGIEFLFSRLWYSATGNHFKKHPKFNIWSYLYLLVFPVIATLLVLNIHGWTLVKSFFIFASIGTFLEWGFGLCYHKMVGQRLWTYHRFGLQGYTSLLSFPLWGMGGILFWLLGQALQMF